MFLLTCSFVFWCVCVCVCLFALLFGRRVCQSVRSGVGPSLVGVRGDQPHGVFMNVGTQLRTE